MSSHQSEIGDFEDQFVDDLAAVYDMELKLVDALDDLSRRAANDNLSKGFAIHRTETETQVRRVEEAFAALDREPERRANPIVDGLLAETEGFDDRATNDGPRNLHFLTAATMTERIEITSYEGLLLTAEQAGLGADVTAPLEANLEQEEKTLRKLEGLAAGSGRKRDWKSVLGL